MAFSKPNSTITTFLFFLLPALTSARCNEFYADPGMPKGMYTYPLPNNKHPILGQIPVSLVVDCTLESGAKGDCPLPVRYAMAIPRDTFILKWSDNSFTFHDTSINNLVKETLGPEKIKWSNFDEPIYQNYTVPTEGDAAKIPWLETSFVSYARVTHCWQGALKGCSGEHAGLDREMVTVCGAAREEGSGADLPSDQQRYVGMEFVVGSHMTPEEVKQQRPLPWDRADEFDWSKTGGAHSRTGEVEEQLRKRGDNDVGKLNAAAIKGTYRVPESFAVMDVDL